MEILIHSLMARLLSHTGKKLQTVESPRLATGVFRRPGAALLGSSLRPAISFIR